MIHIVVIEETVKKLLKEEPTGHDYYHAKRVLQNALMLLNEHGGNRDIVEVACLVHDLIDRKLEDKYKLSINQLKELLNKAKLSNEEIEIVVDIITRMSYSSNQRFDYIEGQIVQDADRLDALGAIGIARTFAFGGRKQRLIYDDSTNELTSVGHFYDKLLRLHELMNTSKAKEIAIKRTLFMKEFLEILKKEVNLQKFRELGD
jgi:uncharacterized protein